MTSQYYQVTTTTFVSCLYPLGDKNKNIITR